jgi:hypothetical protein
VNVQLQGQRVKNIIIISVHCDYNNPYTLTNMHNLHKITKIHTRKHPYKCHWPTDLPLSCTPRGCTYRIILYRSIRRVEMCLVCRAVLCTPHTSLRTTGTCVEICLMCRAVLCTPDTSLRTTRTCVEMCLVCRTVLCTPDTSLCTTGTCFFSTEYFNIRCFYAQNYIQDKRRYIG